MAFTRRFAPRPIPTLAAAAMVALTVSLGRWQVDRAAEKQARQDLFEARLAQPPVRLGPRVDPPGDLLYRRVVMAGRYRPEGQVYIDNRIDRGRAGFHVVTPLELEGGALALVNRGWVARSAAYPKAPEVPVPPGTVEVAGLVAQPPARVLELSADTVTGPVWQNLVIAKYRERMKLDVLPFVVLDARPAPGLAAVEEQPDAGVARHREYALTWFALAATCVVLWIVLNLRKAAR